MKFILGRKIGMTQIFDKEGNQIPVTLVEAGPCKILQIKTKEKDGYTAIQVGFLPKKKNIKKTEKGKEFHYIKEARVENVENYKVGQEIDVSIFKEGEKVKVSGISKGKGFAGVVKRWGFAGRPKTHGTKHELRAPGSIGSATPPRVVKGRKMAGRAGGERVTIKNLEIVKVDKENNLLAIKGALPGAKGSLVEIYSKD
jgi:large subunit ribosomal protein L3